MLPETMQWGPLLVKREVIVLLLGCLAGWSMMWWKFRPQGVKGVAMTQMTSNAILIAIVYWKISPVFDEPMILFTRPLKALYMTGTTRDLLIGFIVAGIYIAYKLYRERISAWLYLDILPRGIIGYYLVRGLLAAEYGRETPLPWGVQVEGGRYEYHPIHTYELVLMLALLAWITFRFYSLAQGKVIQDFLVLFGLGKFMISFFALQTVWDIYLSKEQFVYIAVIIVGLLLPFLRWSPVKISRGSNKEDASKTAEAGKTDESNDRSM